MVTLFVKDVQGNTLSEVWSAAVPRAGEMMFVGEQAYQVKNSIYKAGVYNSLLGYSQMTGVDVVVSPITLYWEDEG